MFERESKREKILEAKSREIKLKQVKSNQQQEPTDLTMVNGKISISPFQSENTNKFEN